MANKLLVWTLVVLCILALFTAPLVRAESDDVEESDEADINEASDDADPTEVDDVPQQQQRPADEVFTTYLFPDYADKKFPAGEKVTVLVGFQNRGDSVYNLTHIMASIHSPFDFNYIIQNYTVREVNSLVGPGEEASVEYAFTPDKSLEAHLEFQLAISLYYNDTTENKFWRSTVHNSTIELDDAKADYSVKTIFTYILALAALGLAGYIGVNLTGVLNKTNVKVVRSAPSASEKAAAASSWETPVYKPKAKAGAFGRQKKKVSSKGGDEPSSPKSS